MIRGGECGVQCTVQCITGGEEDDMSSQVERGSRWRKWGLYVSHTALVIQQGEAPLPPAKYKSQADIEPRH